MHTCIFLTKFQSACESKSRIITKDRCPLYLNHMQATATADQRRLAHHVFKYVYHTSRIYQNMWNIFPHLHNCQSKTLSCEQPAASHYAKSNKAVELSLVSQSNISKYSLTTHIGEDLEVCLCLDINTTKTTVWAPTGMRYLVCRGNRTNNFLSLKSTESERMQGSSLVWSLYGNVHLCVCVCVFCVYGSSDLLSSKSYEVSACMKW